MKVIASIGFLALFSFFECTAGILLPVEATVVKVNEKSVIVLVEGGHIEVPRTSIVEPELYEGKKITLHLDAKTSIRKVRKTP